MCSFRMTYGCYKSVRNFVFVAAFLWCNLRTVISLNCSMADGAMVGQKCYVFYRTKTDWEGAKRMCSDVGLVLARFDFYSDMSTAFGNEEMKYAGILDEDAFGVWVSGNDRYEEEKVIWDDNFEKLDSSLFDRSLPTGYNSETRDCAVMDKFYLLVMELCTNKHYVYCMEDAVAWFTDKHVCRCRENICNDYFECESDACTAGWFDEACQYRDLMGDTTVNTFTIMDNDDETCIVNIPSPQTFKFAISHYFTWLKISFHEPDQASGINITFLSSGSPMECLGRRDLDMEFTKYIYCFMGSSFVDSVTISWDEQKDICSVFIFGGKNIALHAKTNQTGPPEFSPGPDQATPNPLASSLVVDGEEGIVSECARVRNDGLQRLHIMLDRMSYIYEIILYRKRGLTNYTYMSGFRIIFYNDKKARVFEYIDQDNALGPVVKVNVATGKQVSFIVVELDLRIQKKLASEKYLELCEVEVYGDCAPPVYGTFCDKECNELCKDRVCMPNDECLHCSQANISSDCRTIEEIIAPPAPTRRATPAATLPRGTSAPIDELIEIQKYYFLVLTLSIMLFILFVGVVVLVWLNVSTKTYNEPSPKIGALRSEESLDQSSSDSGTSAFTPFTELTEYSESSDTLSTKIM